MARQRAITPRRRKTWTSMAALISTLTADGTTGGSGILSFTGSGHTIMRVMGRLILTVSDAAAWAAGDQVHIGVGLGVFSTDAITALATPDPISDPDFPWLLWNDFFLFTADARPSVIADSAWGPHSQLWEFDTKAMRKIGASQSLAWVVQYADGTGTPAVEYMMGQNRVLLALP